MSLPGRSPRREDSKGDDDRNPNLAVDNKITTSPRRLSPIPSGSRPQWSTGRNKTPQRGSGATASPALDELTDRSSDDSEEDSDELEETGDDATERRELSSSIVAERLDISGKELTYILEVIQQPQRARACGFGDKDRRPLSPPPIVQLRILDHHGNTISPLAVDFHRFILMVDLWNGDQTQQRSIVMHPGARQDQYSLFTHAASRVTSSSHPYEISTFSRLQIRTGPPARTEWPGYGRPAHHTHSPSGSYGHPLPAHHLGPGTPASAHEPLWSPPHHFESLPPRGHSMASPATSASTSLSAHETWSESGSSRLLPEDARGYPSGRIVSSSSSTYDGYPWNGEPSHSMDYSPEQRQYSAPYHRPSTSHVDEGWGGAPHPMTAARDRSFPSGYDDRGHPRPWSSGDSQRRASQAPLFTHMPVISPSAMSSHSSLPPVSTSPNISTPATLYTEPLPERQGSSTSHYSRVLVGSMGSVCQRLKGLDGEYGLFFFAHDLGIRTEGNFSLRFTLVDISTLCDPGVTQGQSNHMLARVFSKSFTVYSAKRFPGVLPTTDLTQCFADQSVRLPTRQKRSNSNHGRPNASRRKK